MSEYLRYPIGRFVQPETLNEDDLNEAIMTLAETPGRLRNAVDGLSMARLDTPYRPGGWTVRQVVHHVAESHMHAFLRMRLALTEDWPVIKPYNEQACAALHDSIAPVEWSLELIESLHARWVMMLQSLKGVDWQRGFLHPERGRITVEMALLEYAWHSKHHLAHVMHLRMREDW